MTVNPADLLDSQEAIAVCKRPIVVAVQFAREAGTCATLEGAVRYRAGDALVTGPAGETWPVSRAAFLSVYAPCDGTIAGSDGTYLKVRNRARAIQLHAPVSLAAGPRSDPIAGVPGDWLFGHEDGSFGIVKNAIFIATYEPY